eukprot:CAMPEP_0202899288 /NCGR_PEP_ID=MMETSP1392-20130828/7563_1 /ASSEMBLY_ACC=CAM_ASM_000868 /TAXON_ID=225041 /ORGANISM="Chlamydomonas chlamydogama, Strain SAG 11-48b" /LENGTH=472 /DNA_ID=CAMNT_0049585429 /DNA_START=133 /DNA_END=1551 /DNA_ORIENTATION=-
MNNNTANHANGSFIVNHNDGKVRVGVLSTSHGVLNTPTSLIYTRRGGPPNLTPDMLKKLKPAVSGYQLDVMQFLAQPSPTTLKQYGAGAHKFLCMEEGVVLASNRDPVMYEYGGRPANDTSVYAMIHTGGRQVTVEGYMDVVEALQPDLYVTMCDEITADVKKKRAVSSVTRTTKWLDACLSLQKARNLSALPLAAITGGALPELREQSAAAAAQRDVAGFALCGFGTGEDSCDERQALLGAALSQLPETKPRFLAGVSSPAEVLDAVSLGVDLFDCGYVSQVTGAGYALTFPLNPDERQAAGQADAPATASGDAAATAASTSAQYQEQRGADAMKMNLWSTAYRLDRRPLVVGCSCFTCTHHSRAYVHHLLQSHEMLAEVLLDMHNTQHYLAFMEAVRGAVQAGSFTKFHSWFKTHAEGEAPLEQPPNMVQGSRGGLGQEDGEEGKRAAAEAGGSPGGSAPATKKQKWTSV